MESKSGSGSYPVTFAHGAHDFFACVWKKHESVQHNHRVTTMKNDAIIMNGNLLIEQQSSLSYEQHVSMAVISLLHEKLLLL